MNKLIFVFPDQDREGIFRDLTSVEAKKIVDYLPSFKTSHSSVGKRIEKICFSNKLNSIIHVPFQAVFYNLDNYHYYSKNTYHLLIPTVSISGYSLKYLERFKKQHGNVCLYALVTDSMHASSPHMDCVRDKLFSDVWDKVLTYDKYDAKEYGFTWFGYSYYSSFDFVKPDAIKSDIYYVGYDKGDRGQIVLDTYNYIQSKGYFARFDVVSNKAKGDNCMHYLKEKIPYPQVIAKVKSTNCILEILQKNQKSQSLRYFEAIVYNKKLLTTNKRIKELPYYDERYMKCFDSIDQIDLEWATTKELIDYHYDGRFSPLKILDFIVSD